ncbi:MAG: proteasome assembly chaperone family protein [Candidatus Ranarchaeia archaeon]
MVEESESDTIAASNHFRVILCKDVSLNQKRFFTGFRSHIGQTGYIVIRHLIEELGGERIGFVDSDLLPPSVFMEDDMLVTPFELYLAENNVFLFARLQPRQAEWSSFTRNLAKWIITSQFSEACLIGGLDNRFITEEEGEARFAATTPGLKKLKSFDLPLLERGLGIFGPLGLLLGQFEMAQFPAISILPYAETGRPDPRGASVAINYLNKIYGFNLSTAKLLEHAKEIEEEIEALLRRQQERVDREQPRQDYYV